MPRRFLPTVLVLLLVSGTAAAQNEGTVGRLVEGRRVRVAHCGDFRAPSSKRFTLFQSDLRVQGRFLALDGDTLRMSTDSDDGECAIPVPCIHQLWVVDGKRAHFWQGAGIGLVAGSAAGALIGSKTEFCLISCSPATLLGLVLGAPAGLIIGGVAGSLVKSDRWRLVSLESHDTSGEPRLDGFQLGAALLF